MAETAPSCGTNGRLRDIGSLGGDNCDPAAISDSGQIIGTSEARARTKRGDQVAHAFAWKDGRMIDLSPGASAAAAIAVNGRRQMIGWREGAIRYKDGFPAARATVWQDGKAIDLGTLGGYGSYALAVNGRGEIAGVSETRKGRVFEVGRHLAIWTPVGG